jgi:hypothetical protein
MGDKTKSDASLLAEVESLSKEVASLKEMIPKTGSYKQLQESIATGITQALAGSRFQEAMLERLRALQMGRDDMTVYIQRAASSKTVDYLAGVDGNKLIVDSILQHRSISDLINQNVTGALSKKEFISALSTAFRAAIVTEPVAMSALVDALAADEKGLLAKSLTANQTFMDRHTQSILTKMRDSLA